MSGKQGASSVGVTRLREQGLNGQGFPNRWGPYKHIPLPLNEDLIQFDLEIDKEDEYMCWLPFAESMLFVEKSDAGP